MWVPPGRVRRSGLPLPPAWPVAEAFTLSLVVAAARAADPARLTPGRCLVALAVVAAVSAAGTGIAPAFAIGGVAWLFDDGFATGSAGVLHWSAGSGGALVLLLGCAATAALGPALLGPALLGPALLGRPDHSHPALPTADAVHPRSTEASRG